MTTKDQLHVTEYEIDERSLPFSAVEKSLLDSRKVFLCSEVNGESIGRVVKELFYLDQKGTEPITLYLDSEGGDVYEILTLYDVIRKQLHCKVNIVVQGKAWSSGTCIAAICATGKRYAGANSTFMLHESSSSTSGKASDLEIDVRETKRVDRVINKLLVKHTLLKMTDLNEKFLKNTYFSSQTAKELGIIDVIL